MSEVAGGRVTVPPTAAPSGIPALADVLPKRAAENFTVASRLLPPETRDHLLAVYGFARTVDDVGDEVAGDRLRLLDLLEDDVSRAYDGAPSTEVMQRLAPTIRRFGIGREPFLRLIEANRRDQTVTDYETFDDLLAYCELSANPVGHLVLAILERATRENLELSDAVCTGLQLAEHWQDVAEDSDRGRVYLPAEDLRRFGCSREDLSAARTPPRLRRLMAFEVARAERLLHRGAPLARRLGGRAGVAVAGFVGGGRAALEAIRRAGYDVLAGPPRASGSLRARWLLRTLAQGWGGRWT